MKKCIKNLKYGDGVLLSNIHSSYGDIIFLSFDYVDSSNVLLFGSNNMSMYQRSFMEAAYYSGPDRNFINKVCGTDFKYFKFEAFKYISKIFKKNVSPR